MPREGTGLAKGLSRRRPAKTGVADLFRGIQRPEWPDEEYSRRKRRGRGPFGAATSARSADSFPLRGRGFRKPPQKGQRGRERPEAPLFGPFQRGSSSKMEGSEIW